MKLRHIFISVLALTGLCSAQAQFNTYSGYFLDNFLYRYQMNPAFGNENNFIGLPGAGNISAGTQGTLHLNEIFYPLNGKTVLFTNPDLPESDLKHFGKTNKLGANFRENIINFGFKGMGGYNTVSISAVGNTYLNAPGSLLNLLRDGAKNEVYDIKNFKVYGNSYAEIAFNHSRDIKEVPGLRVGATIKFVVGFANAYGNFKDAHLSLGEDSWDIISDGDMYLSAKDVYWKTKFNENTHKEYVSGVDASNITGPNGWGGSIDIGATYEWRDFNFSLAVLDLGGICWTQTKQASTRGPQQFQSDKYTFEIKSDEKAWEQMKDQLETLYQLQPFKNGNYKRSTMQGTTMNIGVEYKLPYYRQLSFGLLNSTRVCGGYTDYEFRLSANVVPVKYFSASANVVAGTYGVGFGWLVNVSSGKGINLFLGMDRIPGKLTKQYAPLNSNVNVNFGINVPF